jgi:hypothetical protein
LFLKQYDTKTKKQIYLCNMGKKLTDKERDRMIEVLSEKYKFLLSDDLRKSYDVQSVLIDEIILTDDGTLEEINMEIVVDYLGSCDGDSYSIGHMIRRISEDITDTLYKYVVDDKTFKFTKDYSGNVQVSEPFFLSFDYKADEIHLAKLWVKYEYGL